MHMRTLFGKKLSQSQAFLEDGTRIPVTLVELKDNPIVQVKTQVTDRYEAVQLGYGTNTRAHKPVKGHAAKGAKLADAPSFLGEVRLLDGESAPEVGTLLKASDVFTVGDVVDVTGTSKGKGFAGVVKRHNFRGGPRTHGQSDRERAPGSLGQTTTPGRVYRGKRMAGRMGSERVTVQNLQIVSVEEGSVRIAGLVPGIRGAILSITKKGTAKKPMQLFVQPERAAAQQTEEAAA
jgi:large subunit ribosomal protein L3